MKDIFTKHITRFFVLIFFIVCWFNLQAQAPANYYNGTENLRGEQLRHALHLIIKDHTSLSYNNLWDAFEDTDKKSNGKVWDMYSDKPGGTPAYQYTFASDQCGNYSGEGSCYNREHSLPKSWFNDASPMYTDLFHLYPTDGYVNGMRSNYPYGEVGSATWTSTNGSKRGNSSYPGYSGIVFEPIDEYKGDFARSYFYMSTRYKDKNLGQESSSMFTGSALDTWAKNMLLEWHRNDPVSQKEIDRNNAVYAYQHNRNPFIDHPEFAEYIWNPSIGLDDYEQQIQLSVWPNPVSTSNNLNISWTSHVVADQLTIVDLSGRVVYQKPVENNHVVLDINNLHSGFYFVLLTDNKRVSITSKLIIQ
jgi:endonuclease I